MRRATSTGSGPVGPVSSESSLESSSLSSSLSSSSSLAFLLSLPFLAFLASLSFSSLASLPLAAGAVVAAGGSGSSSRPSLKPTTISARRFLPALCSSQSSSNSCTVHGKLASDSVIWLRPSSMRLAIAISPSRVSNSTVPISRMYMRTGSVVRPPSASSAVSVRSEEHTSELQSLMRISYAVLCLKNKTTKDYANKQHLHFLRTNYISTITQAHKTPSH